MEYCKNYDLICQNVGGLKIMNLKKLVTTLLKELFMKWMLDFIGPIKCLVFFNNKYRLLTIDNATKWGGSTSALNQRCISITMKFI
jgi:hypothetical protein